MQLLQPNTALCESSTLVAAHQALTPVQRLDLIVLVNRDQDLWASWKAVFIELSGFVNGETGLAWPTQQQLGQRLGMVRQNVNRALRELEARGYLVRCLECVKPGEEPRQVYRLTFPSAPAVAPADVIAHDYMGESPTVQGGESPTVHRNPVKENPVTEPGKGEPPTGVPGGSTPGTRRPPVRQPTRPPALVPGYLPDDWEPSEELIARAMRVCELTREQVAHQTERFRSHCRSKATRSADWREDWWRWMENVRPGARWRERMLGQAGPPSYAEQRAVRDNVGRTAHAGGWST